jgi:two-component system, NarL family, sensor kinase
MATSLVVVGLFTAIGIVLQQRRGTKEAIRLSSESARLIGRGIVGPLVTTELLAGDPAALAKLDQVVRERVLDDEIVRVKVWQADGRIAYSDQRELIGRRYQLAEEDVTAISSDEVEGEVSDLTQPENSYEQPFGRLLEFYLGVPTPSGERVLVEAYQRFGGISAGGKRLWLAFAPTMLGAIALLWLSQAPLAWSLASRLRRGQQERERLLLRAVEASNIERRRIAADLHDGVVQRLAGTAFSLAAASERLPGASTQETNESLQESTVSVRRAMQELRSLIVEIHPPILANEGLAPALSDLVSPLAARNIVATLDVDPAIDPNPEIAKLLFRGAQEAIRNVLKHSGAQTVAVSVAESGGRVRLTVDDDGRGIDPAMRAKREENGHVGLGLLRALTMDLGGSLNVTASKAGGTRLTLELPAR